MNDIVIMNGIVILEGGIGDALGNLGNAIMAPLHWAVSCVIVLAHALWGAVFGADSGWAWLLAIVTLTIVVRLLMLPLFMRQLSNSRDMQALQPKIKALQKKYGHDQVRLGQETQKLYKDEGVNPMASCLPLLIQMPIFFALFQVLNGAASGEPKGAWLVDRPHLVESLRHATIFGAELSGRFFPMDHGFGPTQGLAVVLILAMTGVLLFQQMQMLRRNMAPEALEGPLGQQQKMMVYLFPFIYMITGVNIPIGVLIYWLTTNLWTMGQQFVIIHRFPTPGTPAYVDWEERMRAQGKDPREIEAARRAKRVREPKATLASEIVEGEKPKVARQQNVNRTTTVRRDAEGKQIVTRSQPQRQTRQQRKKK